MLWQLSGQKPGGSGFLEVLQFQFSTQWQKLKAYANGKGCRILGDIPIYVSADSVDAWTGGPLFELDAEGGFARVAGCPPDYFSAEGQLWGNPLYNWAFHQETGYAWWVRRVRHALGIYDLLRIDHFRGFDTYWAIPADAPLPAPAGGSKAPAWSCSGHWRGRWANCPSLQRTWASCSPVCAPCWQTAASPA